MYLLANGKEERNQQPSYDDEVKELRKLHRIPTHLIHPLYGPLPKHIWKESGWHAGMKNAQFSYDREIQNSSLRETYLSYQSRWYLCEFFGHCILCTNRVGKEGKKIDKKDVIKRFLHLERLYFS